MSKPIIGKRIYDNRFPDKPGEYAKSTKDGEWLLCTPNGHYGTIRTHTVIEHEDGTISVSPSILIKTSSDGGKSYQDLWHGYLEKGIWREC